MDSEDSDKTFDEFCRKIEKNYHLAKTGEDLRWSFLYTHKSTFHSNQKFMFVGLNPGGGPIKGGYSDYPYFGHTADTQGQTGNAYLDEDWIGIDGTNKGMNPLQKQIQLCFEEIAKAGSLRGDYKDFMRSSLFLNLVPYRSPKWDQLSKNTAVLKFTQELWKDILDYIHPTVILTMGTVPFGLLDKIIKARGATVKNSMGGQIGWGKETYSLVTYLHDDQELLLARVPHLSTRKIFSRENCREARNKVTSAIAEKLFN